ncbi:hypothetical protein C9374_008350 [Naegleria lovaniensis]|uniref:Uncharacterized protein n=1 Tax=Naegleria lovaniensis TaxID=51637 RepID=A0AA88KFC8_NAELO|nr:uncharacterized protein C9374_008350 [Naegleria lovaniensis]KAG2378207.1 hypothetical protein C9374_008350 [Naegleria lovaniensis]
MQTKEECVLTLVSKVLDLQNDRILAYKQFESSFKSFKANPNDKIEILKYQRVVETTTQEFQEISTNIRGVQQQLKDLGQDKFSTMIDNLQNLERDKLQTTISIQKIELSCDEEKKKLECDHDEKTCQHTHHSDEEELGGAKLLMLQNDLKKFKQYHAELINSINEILEEFKYDIEDLKSIVQDQKEMKVDVQSESGGIFM